MQALQVGPLANFTGLDGLTQLTCLSFIGSERQDQAAMDALSTKLAALSNLQELHCILGPNDNKYHRPERLQLCVPMLTHLTCLTLQGNVRALETLRGVAALPGLRALGLRTHERRLWPAIKHLAEAPRLRSLQAVHLMACCKQSKQYGHAWLLKPTRAMFTAPCHCNSDMDCRATHANF